MERYEVLKDIGDGNVSVTRLMRNKETEEVVAVKYIPWGFKMELILQNFLLSCQILRACN